MPEKSRSAMGSPASAAQESSAFAAPQISLPKGGGAIRGMGEKFAANPVTGTGSLSVPIYSSPGRSGIGPQLSLSYDSGSGNGPFGFGWSIGLPSITRKTDKGLPQYREDEESDTFILSGAEDLVPALVHSAGQWSPDIVPSRTVYGSRYAIHRYRPRIEGLFARIERWVNLSNPRDTFWRSISKDNLTTWYGKTEESRIADPTDPSRIFSWMICESYDDKGNVLSYQYKKENSAGVDLSQAHERNRTDASRSAKRYVKNILYGNRTPYFPDLTAVGPVALPTDWCFQLVFDYGEHDLMAPVPSETGQSWNCRPDPFSTYRSTFEVRTYRLCRRVLMFHHFADEPNVGLNCLVRSTDLQHASTPPPDPSQPFFSYLLSATQTGYVRNSGSGYQSKSLPPLEFKYTEAVVDETVRDVDSESLKNLPYGLDGSKYRWVDLDGEGLSGILTEQGGGWFYKPNLSPINQQIVDGEQVTLPRFGPAQLVRRQPSLTALNSGRQQLMDLSGDGRLDLVEFSSPTPGFFEHTEDENWEPFRAFESVPVLDWRNPNLRFIDLTGDGFPDLLISSDDAFLWHPSLSKEGFGPAQCVAQSLDEETGPQLVFADGTESIFLADMSGDGLTDLVRIRNGEVCYWPNLGYGRFGPKVTMDESPRFDRSEQFDGRRIHLADIDGSGTVDIIYFASREVSLYFNRSGNGWGAERALRHFPSVESVSSGSVLDLLGNGTACLLWSSPLPGNAHRPMRYIDLMGGQKPHLLVHATNNLGAETVVAYAPSTKFYVGDKVAGTPWLTRLPFPVHVVERVETCDYVSRNRFVTRYAYHHGYYDGVEREFRGFGRVDQWDTEELATLSDSTNFPQATNHDPSSIVPPTWTKTWFHTGASFLESGVSRHFGQEYCREDDSSDAIAGLSDAQLESMLLDDTVLPNSILLQDGRRIPYALSGNEIREACRALRGSILRQELYALDNTNASNRPYVASERNYTIEVLQPQGPNRHGVFLAHPRGTIDYNYERKLYMVVGNALAEQNAPLPNARNAADPRVMHTITLAVDLFGNVLQSVVVGYGRRYLDPALIKADQSKQTTLLCTYTENLYTNAVLADDTYRAPLPAESSSYELLQVQPVAGQAGVTHLLGLEELQSSIQAASDGAHDIPFENLDPAGLYAGQPYRRLIGRARTVYRPDDMGAAAGTPKALLSLGKLESLALPGTSYKLAFTAGLISQVYQRRGVALLPAPAGVMKSVAPDGGAYIDVDTDGQWWTQSGRVYYALSPAVPDEENEARRNFYLPRRFEDPFCKSACVNYDNYGLLAIQTTDAVGNVAAAVNDYRALVPSLLTDPNGNRAAVTFDVLGMVAGTSVMGKTTENLGDSLGNFTADLTQQQIDDFHAAVDPHILAGPLLGNATTRIVYDVQRFVSTRAAAPDDPTLWEPVFAATIVRETHVSDLSTGQQTRTQITFSYSDGYGREIQKKIQAEPGPVVDEGPVINPRWVGSGWTIFNNKGKPVRQYEPFFSQLPKGHQFEFGMQVGVSPILFYDPLERVVATLHPDHTYDKVVFDPWHQDTWDVNDTVLQTDPTADPDVGDFFKLLPNGDYSPSWYALRTDQAYSIEAAQRWPDPTIRAKESEAATKAAAHANTPGTAHFDALGRTFLTIADNAADGKYSTRVELDIQGLQRSVTDALDRKVMTYDYDMLGNRILQASMEAGERWVLNDVTGKAIRAWDSRGHNYRTEYDALRRPTGLSVQGMDSVNSDPRTLAAEVLCEKSVYGEGQPDSLNLRTRVFQHYDTAGVVTSVGQNPDTGQNEAYDFKGNLLRGSRQFLADHKSLSDWSGTPPALLPEVFAGSTQYDALNRPIAATTPDGSVVHPTYNEANFLETASVNLRGAPTATTFVANIDYDAKGQRLLIEYGNDTRTDYAYDPVTFRLVRLTTTRVHFPANQGVVQDLSYSYDPAGNITHIQDDADIQNAVFFRNQRVEPSNDYTYDAVYRLILASGREQLGLGRDGKPLAPTASSYNDVPRAGLISPSDGNAMGTYREQYKYDAAGNFLQFIHRGSQPASPGWTRSYTYNEASQLEPGKFSNRVTRTTVSGNQPLVESYTHDVHGNMTAMPHLQFMLWDFKDELHMTRGQAVNATDADGALHPGERTYYVYDSAGQRARKVTESAGGVKTKERFYLGGFEVYREYSSTNTVSLERQTLNIMDDKRRVALVETRTQGSDGSTAQLIRYQFSNHLGSASLELDHSAHVICYEEYCPYGNTSYQAGRSAVEVTLKRYRYTGMERDEESGLNYHGSRYYAPWLGRWLSPDPAGLIDSFNLFEYALSNPARMKDTSGLEGEESDFSELNQCVAETSQSPELAAALDQAPAPIPQGPSGTNYSSAASQGRAAYRAANPMPAGSQAQHWTKEITSGNTNMPPDIMNENMSPLQSAGRASAPFSQGQPATTLLTDPAGGGTKYSVDTGSVFGNEHKFSDRYLIVAEEAKNLSSANPRNAAVEAGQTARWRMTGEPGPGPGRSWGPGNRQSVPATELNSSAESPSSRPTGIAGLAFAIGLAALVSKNVKEFIGNSLLNIAIGLVPELGGITGKDEGSALGGVVLARYVAPAAMEYVIVPVVTSPVTWVAAGVGGVAYLMFMDKSSFMADQKLADRAIAEYKAGHNINPFCAQCHGKGGALDPNNEWNLRATYGTALGWGTKALSSPFFSTHR